MKEVFLLTKILLKSSNKTNSEKNSKLKYFGFAILYLYIAVIIGFVSYEAISALKAINQEAVFLNLAFVAMLSFVLIRSLFTSINFLFFSKDIEVLLPLPIKPYKIVMAKLNCLIVSEYYLCLIILLPVLIVYGVLMNANILFYIMSTLLILTFPVIPVLLVSFLVTLVMKFTNIIKNKDFVQYITVIISLILIVGIQFLTGADSEITNEELANMLVKANGLVEIYSKYFVTLKPTMQGILNYNNINGWLNLLSIIVITSICYMIVSFVCSKFYIKTVTSCSSSGTKKRKNNNKREVFERSSIAKSYIKKEFHSLIRNPIFFMQCIVPSILFPIIISVPIYVSIQNTALGAMEDLTTIVGKNIGTPIGLAISIAILIFFFMFNFVSVTAISRESSNAVFMKYIPINLEKQCLYKIMPGIILNIIPILYLLVCLYIFVPYISLKIILYIAVISTLISIFSNYLMIIIDLKRPKLQWITEYAVVKQNFNMFYEMAIYLLEIGIIVFLGLFIQSIELFSIILIIFLAMLIQKIRKYIQMNDIKLFNKII